MIQPEKVDIARKFEGDDSAPMFHKLAVLAREYQNMYGGTYKQAIAYIKKDLKFLLLNDKGND